MPNHQPDPRPPPGSGPPDPDNILAAISGGATWSSNHLVINGSPAWLMVNASNAWALSTAPASCVDQDTFNLLAAGSPAAGNKFQSGTRLWTLEPATVSGGAWALAMPA